MPDPKLLTDDELRMISGELSESHLVGQLLSHIAAQAHTLALRRDEVCGYDEILAAQEAEIARLRAVPDSLERWGIYDGVMHTCNEGSMVQYNELVAAIGVANHG